MFPPTDKNADIDFEWHYIDISDADWAKNIEARNAAVAAGETTDYAVDSGLLQKVLTLFARHPAYPMRSTCGLQTADNFAQYKRTTVKAQLPSFFDALIVFTLRR